MAYRRKGKRAFKRAYCQGTLENGKPCQNIMSTVHPKQIKWCDSCRPRLMRERARNWQKEHGYVKYEDRPKTPLPENLVEETSLLYYPRSASEVLLFYLNTEELPGDIVSFSASKGSIITFDTEEGEKDYGFMYKTSEWWGKNKVDVMVCWVVDSWKKGVEPPGEIIELGKKVIAQ